MAFTPPATPPTPEPYKRTVFNVWVDNDRFCLESEAPLTPGSVVTMKDDRKIKLIDAFEEAEPDEDGIVISQWFGEWFKTKKGRGSSALSRLAATRRDVRDALCAGKSRRPRRFAKMMRRVSP